MAWNDDLAASVDRTIRRTIYTGALLAVGMLVAAFDIWHRHREPS